MDYRYKHPKREPLHGGSLVPMSHDRAHMDEALEQAGRSARRDLLTQAPSMYAMARLAGLARRKQRAAA